MNFARRVHGFPKTADCIRMRLAINWTVKCDGDKKACAGSKNNPLTHQPWLSLMLSVLFLEVVRVWMFIGCASHSSVRSNKMFAESSRSNWVGVSKAISGVNPAPFALNGPVVERHLATSLQEWKASGFIVTLVTTEPVKARKAWLRDLNHSAELVRLGRQLGIIVVN